MRLLEEFSQHHNGVSSDEYNTQSVLSQREVEILREVALGASNGEIATKLFLSVNTVKHHIHNILSKLRLENRRAAILYAQQAGLLKPIK